MTQIELNVRLKFVLKTCYTQLNKLPLNLLAMQSINEGESYVDQKFIEWCDCIVLHFISRHL